MRIEYMDNEMLFELMTKMYARMEEGFKNNDERFNKLDSEITKVSLTIENDIKPKINALLDGYKQLAEGQKEIKKSIQALSERQDNQELQIRVLKGIAK